MSSLDSSHQEVHALYRAHHGWLQGWLRGKLGNAGDAADLAQDTFIKVMLAQVSQQIREPRAYLATVANRLVLDHFRRQRVERSYLEVLAALPVQDMPSLEEQAIMKEALIEIDGMLDGLGPKVKQVFILSQFEDLSYAEIARRLDISLRSVNTYVARAMAHCCLLLP
ncbi:ECF sigma factor FoxI [Oxalicibacterium flavum]|uniref:ECF sigma factor FoxI n=1 Tax=Oxalicibacterium flavum TaxID=179467 RepID=A0A8J2ULX9_9BURK|nr:sigma-70 family RNA polymerase sigma factor [Oxalicibacterium flavum]GGC02664.1 ECF sigma factor FoxI [Oxalicibacterium flavum]